MCHRSTPLLFYVADLKNNTFQMRCFVDHANINDIPTYMRSYAPELGDRILALHPPLHAIDDPPSPMIGKLLRKPYPAQTLAIMGLVRRWQQARAGAVIAECGTGKTLISLGAVQTHAGDRPFTALAMVPPHLGREMVSRNNPHTAARPRVHHRRAAHPNQCQEPLRCE